LAENMMASAQAARKLKSILLTVFIFLESGTDKFFFFCDSVSARSLL
jgi:hypothetical protein